MECRRAKIIIAIIALLIFSAAEARADDSWYVSAGVGAGFLNDADVVDPTGNLAALRPEAAFDEGDRFFRCLGLPLEQVPT